MDCQEIEPQLEAFVLNALEPEEMAAVSAHLDGCERCRRLESEYGDMVSVLPTVLADASPWELPDSLRARTLARIADLEKANPSSTEKLSWWTWLRPSELALWRSTAAVLFVLLLVVAGWGWQNRTALAEERAKRVFLQSEFEKREVIFELVDSQDTQRVYVPAVDDGSNSYGKIYTRPDKTGIVFLGGNLPKPPQGYGYHIFLTNEDSRYLAGVLDVNDEGFGLILVDTHGYIPRYDEVDVALQPLNSTEPGKPILSWNAPDS